MSQQQDLFNQPVRLHTEPKKLVRRSDPVTSIEAACSLKAGGLEEKVLVVIKSFGRNGCISDDVMGCMIGFGIQTITPRYKKLKDKGLVEETGEKRLGKSGRRQLVMRAI